MRRPLMLVASIYLAVLAVSAMPDARVAAFAPPGQDIFRYDTFGDEQLWTDTLALHTKIQNVSPAAALGLGLKVDADALPQNIVRALKAGAIDLNDPAVTLQLLQLNAVVGVIGKVDASGTLESIGVACALCHSTVDDSLTTGIGRRLDGWPNRDLNVGAIVALSDNLSDTQREAVTSWGPGRYDARLQAFDGIGFITLNTTTVPVLIPPAYGLQGVEFETYTGDGPISYWNAYVGISQMGGKGNFDDPRLPLTITQSPDLVTPKLPALLAYQLSLRAPMLPPRSFDRVAALRGERLFEGMARCAECHSGRTYTDVTNGGGPLLHAPAEVGQDPAYALRPVTKMYRTTPLAGAWQHAPYFHDGSAANFADVVDHYDALMSLGLTAAQKADLVAFLKSL